MQTWQVTLGDGRTLRRDQLPAPYFACVPREQVIRFAIVDDAKGELWATTDVPITYRRRVQVTQGGGARGIHLIVFEKRVVWLFEDRQIMVLPTFGDRSPFRAIKPMNEAERDAVAHHLDSPPFRLVATPSLKI